jgi:hypothetical protein
MTATSSSSDSIQAPAGLMAATTGPFGFYPGNDFVPPEHPSATASPETLWFFRHESIVVPHRDAPVADFDRQALAYADVAAWHARTPIGSATERPPLIWIAAPELANGCRLVDAAHLDIGTQTVSMALHPRHPLNRAYFNEDSALFLSARPLRVRGQWRAGQWIARCFWPEDFRLHATPTPRPLDRPTTENVRERVRELPDGGARSPFIVERLWQRSNDAAPAPGQPVIAFILNGAQGDDDEAHGGHFAIATGNVGENGAIDDWLVSNYYTLDSESEKGIIAAQVPLDNYFADLNAGQAWYRPSCMVVAVLKDPRAAIHIQSALARVFQHFYRHRLAYQHARANCAGISVSTMRALGWQIPAAGPESWALALPALPLATLASCSLKKGKATFDYLTEDRTRLYPAVAFEEITADLLRLADGSTGRTLSDFERVLADDIGSLLFVRIPQLPSNRAWGNHPVVSSREYHARVPRDPAERQIVPVGPRPFPKDFIDPEAPREPPLRSDYAVAAWAITLVAAFAYLLLA